MENASAAKKRAIVDLNVTAQQTIVRDDCVVGDPAVVTDVRSSHQKILVAQRGHAAFERSAMDRAKFPDDIIVPDPNTTVPLRIE
jgi:hypothetical protein